MILKNIFLNNATFYSRVYTTTISIIITDNSSPFITRCYRRKILTRLLIIGDNKRRKKGYFDCGLCTFLSRNEHRSFIILGTILYCGYIISVYNQNILFFSKYRNRRFYLMKNILKNCTNV